MFKHNVPQTSATVPSMATGTATSLKSDLTPLSYSVISELSNRVPTGITPILTPNTITSIEQSFLEIGSKSAQGSKRTQAGFVPPVVDTSSQASNSSNTSSTASLNPGEDIKAKLEKLQASTAMDPLTAEAINTLKSGKSRRRIRDEDLPVDERERRKVRRERNKLAAAKCRKRRVDQTNVLLDETDQLEANKASLQQEIAELQTVKEQLEFVLQAHQPVCKVKRKLGEQSVIQTTKSNRQMPAMTRTSATPNSLPVSSKAVPMGSSVTEATGIPIVTPTRDGLSFDFALDNFSSMTSLSCASEIFKRSNSMDLASPEALVYF